MSELIARQGDIGVIKNDSIPADAVESDDRVVVYSKDTGNSHNIVGGKVYRTKDMLFVKSTKNNAATLVHKGASSSHADVKLPVGTYEIRRAREITFSDEVRNVID